MQRKPINQPQYEVVLSKEQPVVRDLMPKYRYEFQGLILGEEPDNMYKSLIDFLETNESLAINESITEEYIQGFQKSLALTRLWLDSLYIPQDNQ